MANKPRWRVNVLSFIGHGLAQPGDEVFYTPGEGGGVGANLSPLNDEAQAIVEGQLRDHPDKKANQALRDQAKLDDELADDKASGDGPVAKPLGDKRTDGKKVGKGGAASVDDLA